MANGIQFRILSLLLEALLISCLFHKTNQDPGGQSSSTKPGLPTVTVRGFLNFKTTVDGTVIVFTPASELPQPAVTKDTSKSTNNDQSVISTNVILHSNALDSKDTVASNIQDLTYTESPKFPDPIKSDVGDLAHLGHRVKEPFLQHISDNAVLPSTVQTNNDLGTDINKRNSPAQNQYPTGLVTVLDGTHIQSGSTTVFETKVIGTYIDGKYAQILQSTSKIIIPTTVYTPAYKATSSFIKAETTSKPQIDSLVTSSDIKTSVTDPTSSSSYTYEIFSSSLPQPSEKPSSSSSSSVSYSDNSNSIHVIKSSSKNEHLTKAITLQSSFNTLDVTTEEKVQPTKFLTSVKTSDLQTYPSYKTLTSRMTRPSDDDNTVLSSSRSVRTNSTRIRFIAPRRPSQTVRLNRFKVRLTVRQDSSDNYDLSSSHDDEELDEESSTKEEDVSDMQKIETQEVDPANVIYQETTITSEVTLHVGRRKSVRTLTITTSVPLTINPTESQFLLMTLEAEKVADDDDIFETATSSIVTRTFTTTERTIKSSVVPVYDGHTTSYHTITESFFIMKIITAYRTLPPTGITILPEDQKLTEAAEATLDVAANIPTSVIQSPPQETSIALLPAETLVKPSMSYPTNVNSPQITNPLLSFGQALSNNPLAAVYLGLQQLNAQMTLYSTITQTSTYVTTDTIYSTKTIRFYDGRVTRFRTISDPISTKKRTVITTVTSVQPYINTQAYQQQQQLQKLIAATQLSPPQPQYSTITSVHTTVTTATSLSTRIYTLIYNGFSTKFRTVTSTRLYPTTVTVTSTKEVPIVPTQPPAPFAYPYPA